MKGVELSARFGLAPNSLRYCGEKGFSKAFAAYLARKNPSTEKSLASSLGKFKAHYAYLRLIAEASGKRPFDRQVTEALWIGNSLLAKVEKKDMAKLIVGEFTGEGLLPLKKAREYASRIPDGALPHHTFHVLYIHTITGVVKPSLLTADNCRPSWGKVVKVGKNSLEVQSQKLVLKRGRLALAPCRKKWKRFCAGMLLVPEVEKGDFVASHWGFAVMKISPSQKKRMEKYTKANIAALQELHALRGRA